MEEFIMLVLGGIVSKPEEIKITASSGSDGETLYNVSVAECDMGRVIGKGGRMIRSIKALFKTAAARQNVSASMEIR